MSILNLKLENMIALIDNMLTHQQKLLGAHPILAAYVPELELVLKQCLEAQATERARERLGALNKALNEVDAAFDLDVRFIFAVVEAYIRLAELEGNGAEAASLKALLNAAFPAGKGTTNLSYPEEAGSALSLMARLTSPMKAHAQRLSFGDHTVMSRMESVEKKGAKLNELLLTRDNLTLAVANKPNKREARAACLQVMSTYLDLLKMPTVPEEVAALLRNPIELAIAAQEARAEQRKATAEQGGQPEAVVEADGAAEASADMSQGASGQDEVMQAAGSVGAAASVGAPGSLSAGGVTREGAREGLVG